MNSVDQTLNLTSERFTCRYCEYVNTLLESLLSQDIENQLIKLPKYSVKMLRLRQNECNTAFDMLVTGTSATLVAGLTGISICHATRCIY